MSLAAAHALFKALVNEKDEDAVDFVELMTCVCLLAPGSLRERLRYVFDVYDLDEDGKIESPRDTTLLLLALLHLPLYGIVHHTHEHARPQKIAIDRILREEMGGYVSFDAFYDWFVAYVDPNSCAADSNVMTMQDAKSNSSSTRGTLCSSVGVRVFVSQSSVFNLSLEYYKYHCIAHEFENI